MKFFLIAVFSILILLIKPLYAELNIQELTSQNGTKFWLAQEKSIPFVSLEIRFRGGTSMDDNKTRGAVSFMTAMLEEGAGELDAQAFSKARDSIAASFNFDVSRDNLSVSARFLSDTREEAIQLLKQALTTPRFDKEAMERVRKQIISIIASNQKNQNKIAQSKLYELTFPDHIYSSSGLGSTEKITLLNGNDLRQAHKVAITRDRISVSIVGDISEIQAIEMLDELLENLPNSSKLLPKRVRANLDLGTVLVDYPSPQSVAFFTFKGISRTDQDFFAAFVMNHILGGGGFNSRLMKKIREERGLTYSVNTSLAQYDHAELYLGMFQSSNDKISEAIGILKKEIALLANNGVNQEELEEAKKFLIGAYPLRFDGNVRIANILAGMQFMGLDKEYIKLRNVMVSGVTSEDVARVAKRLLSSKEFTLVVVGKPEGLKASH
ncbi:MAG: pitrilysin family protein [Paracoccaceae bacterium]|nr:pitrilysin family protein [Paracoccaceae bacterium]